MTTLFPSSPLARLRTLVRRRDLGLVLLAIAAGALAGMAVAAIGHLAQAMHVAFFRIDLDDRLSAAPTIPWMRAALVPMLGGGVLGVVNLALARWRPRRPVDPIEANALHGGTISIADSLVVAVQTTISNGVGASVGLEAAYTQFGSGLASRLGTTFGLRRSDMRLLVGCGSAGAIAAAFGAPLTGAFYGFEVIIASYAPAMLAPVAAAAIAGASAAKLLGNEPYVLAAAPAVEIGPGAFASLVLLGLVCAGLAVATMQSVTWWERIVGLTRLPLPLRPLAGGIVIGVMALITPRVLSAGHGVVEQGFLAPSLPLWTIFGLIILKVLASSVSLGTGFRGGLFFASLLLGMLLGQFWSNLVDGVFPALSLDYSEAALAGMAGVAAAIIGAPLTMSFLALEVTRDFSITAAVLITVIIAWIVVRETFGYSFATWRFHMRGEQIRSAQDVGWIRDLTVARLMRRDVVTVGGTTTLAVFRQRFPLGSASRVIAINPAGAYLGLVDVSAAHHAAFDQEAAGRAVQTLVAHPATTLLPEMTVRAAAALFETAESEALAVVDTPTTRRVVGLLTEAHALRRYAEEVDRARRDLAGER